MKVRHRDQIEFEKWNAALGAGARAAVHAKVELIITRQWPIGMPLIRYLGDGLFELRLIAHGLRLYFAKSEDEAEFLAYGRTDTQARDIAKARRRKS